MLLKKIERGQQFLAAHQGLFACPLCQQDLTQQQPYQLRCPQGHQFDLNRKGSLYFLAHHVQTEYDREMLVARQHMIQAGLYEPLLSRLAELIQETTPHCLLDVGCGEGSFLQRLDQLAVAGTKVGFDISKDGIALATEQELDAFWCVADLTKLPFAAQQFSHLLNIFSPSHYGEFKRVLAPGGRVVKVVPGSDYLKELRQVFYEDQASKQTYSNDLVVDKFQTEMRLLSRERLTYQFTVPAERQMDLLKMSPISWGATAESYAQAQAQKVEKITIDVEILVGE